MKTWTALKEGDTVDLIAPGFACTEAELKGAIAFLKSWKLNPRVPRDLFGKHVLCANNDLKRHKHLVEALCAEDSKAVWCLRGGYGSIRLLPLLAEAACPKQVKLFIGLSDITTLHLYLNQKWKWPTIHGPMLDRLGKGETPEKYVSELKSLLFGELATIRFSRLKALNAAAKSRKTVHGEVTGGNLITLQSSLGTADECRVKGRILFLEEIGERGYRVDRALEHMRQCGVFEKAKAVVFGDFTGGNEPDGRNLVAKVLQEFADSVSIPVLSGVESGHGPVQRPVPFGTPAILSLGERNELVCTLGTKTRL